jgi:hypothetical protein
LALVGKHSVLVYGGVSTSGSGSGDVGLSIDLFDESCDVIFSFFEIVVLQLVFEGKILEFLPEGDVFLIEDAALLDEMGVLGLQ